MVRESEDINVQGLEWDTENTDHVAAHDVTPTDVQAVLKGEPMFLRNLRDRGGSQVMVGYDDRGRHFTSRSGRQPRRAAGES